MNVRYAYLDTRVSILASRLWSETQLKELLHSPTFFPQSAVTSTPSTPTFLTDFNENWVNLSNAQIEQTWLMAMLADFEILIRPLSGIEQTLLIYWLHKCEIANLKMIIRGKLAQLTNSEIQTQLVDLGKFSQLPIAELLEMEDIHELLRRLERGRYGIMARHSRRVLEKLPSPYFLDGIIDRYYLLGFMQQLGNLSRNERHLLQPLVSIFMDRLNLLWLLRYRLNYQLSAAETYYLLVPTSFNLHRQLLKKLLEFNQLPEILNHLPPPLNKVIGEANSIFEVDQRLSQEVRRVAEYTLKWKSFSLARVVAYVLLREIEMRRIMAIVKGKRLGLSIPLIQTAADYANALTS